MSFVWFDSPVQKRPATALFTPDFNLSGHGDIHLSFHSLWEQNQDSIAAVEYSINQGQTWLFYDTEWARSI